MLAACGNTSIQIAHKLYITVSTVEQRLTRVYPKLGVSGRAELPVDIQPLHKHEIARNRYLEESPECMTWHRQGGQSVPA